MKKRKLIYLFVLVISAGYPGKMARAQSNSFFGPRSAALAHASTTLCDENSIFNNPGSLGAVESASISLGYLNLYQVEGLNSVFAAFSSSVKNGYASIGVFSFGDQSYKNDKIAFAYGNKFGVASLGTSVNYHHYMIEGFGSSGFISFDVGGLAELGPKILVSGLIKNVGQARVSKITGEYFPTIMSVGLSFRPSEQLVLISQYDKDLENTGIMKVGLEYTYSSLVLRTGLVTEPVLMTFGFGFHHKKLNVDYGLLNHPVLGKAHSFAVSFHFK